MIKWLVKRKERNIPRQKTMVYAQGKVIKQMNKTSASSILSFKELKK
jgi:hypothetical protein